MAIPEVEIEGVNVVLVGSFNPRIFQPAWFAAQKLISEKTADAAEVEVLHRDVTVFAVDWLNVQVIPERFIAVATQAPYELLRDFVTGTFEILNHTPVRLLGLNLDRHFKMASKEAWDGLGKRLAPPEPWESALDGPGLASLTMLGQRSDEQEGAVRVKVEPSAKVEFGVHVQVNDHYVLASDGEEVPANVAVSVIREQWDSFLERSDKIATEIVGAS